MHKVRIVAAFLASLTVTLGAALSLAEGPVVASAGSTAPKVAAEARPAAWKYQIGAARRIGGERVRDDSGKAAASLDISWSDWQRGGSAWGLGLHAVFSDDGGPRFAPRLHWRTPLGSGRAFLQGAAGAYLVAIDKEMFGPPLSRIRLPGWFGEVECGVTDAVSLVAGFESLPVDLFAAGVCGSDCGEDPEPIASTSITNYWLGARAGGKAGILMTLAGAAALGIFFAALT